VALVQPFLTAASLDLSARICVVAGFWPILWIAGVAVLISGLTGWRSTPPATCAWSGTGARTSGSRRARRARVLASGPPRLRRPSPGPASRPGRRTRTSAHRSRSRTSAWDARPRSGSRPGTRPHVRTTSTRRNTAKAGQGRPSSRSRFHSTTQAPRHDPHPAHSPHSEQEDGPRRGSGAVPQRTRPA
jgi:hypothetical protein